ncbi:tetratricopeptide repeat protein [bacterium]|nr:tetratricopeptide repeat protein [bacterium]
MSLSPDWRRSAVTTAVLLAAVAIFCHARALWCGWIWDDDFYVWNNPTLKLPGGLFDIWFKPLSIPQYYPLVHTTYWLEYRLWGDWPAGYHAVNVLLHATSAILLWLLLRRLAVPGAWLAAALFAVHPLGVESVAWVTERKNTLSLCLALVSLSAWLSFRDASAASSRWKWYGLSLALFAASLLAKTVSVSLVGVLLVITWWQTGRITRRDLLLALPYLAIGLPLALATVWLEKHHVGAADVDWGLSIADRIVLAGRVICFYATKLAWPHPLSFFYDRWQVDAREARQWLFPAVVLSAAAIAWALREKIGRGPLAAILLFAGCLFPALGFFDVYPFKFSFVADHFAYHAMPAFLAATAALLWTILPSAASLRLVIGTVLVAVLAIVSWQRTGVFHDQESLYLDTLAKTPSCGIAAGNLGVWYLDQGRVAEAIPMLERGAKSAIFADERGRSLANIAEGMLRLDRPHDAARRAQESLTCRDTFRARALLLLAAVRTGDDETAERVIAESPATNLEKPEMQLALGERALQAGEPATAAEHFERCLPKTDRRSRNNALMEIGIAYLKAGNEPAGAAAFERIEADPALAAKAAVNLGVAAAMRGDIAGAVTHFTRAIEIDPLSGDGHANLGKALMQVDQLDRAKVHLDAARRLNLGRPRRP